MIECFAQLYSLVIRVKHFFLKRVAQDDGSDPHDLKCTYLAPLHRKKRQEDHDFP